jgi:hypothetical protein
VAEWDWEWDVIATFPLPGNITTWMVRVVCGHETALQWVDGDVFMVYALRMPLPPQTQRNVLPYIQISISAGAFLRNQEG